MRLIHTTDLTLHEFFTEQAPERYAILSHCWGDDEVSFTEFTHGTHQDGSGYKKILDCCTIAKSQGLDWAWVDTCCIDKASSAELSEAINSMFQWYQRSTICYVFLPDYKSNKPTYESKEEPNAVAVDLQEPSPVDTSPEFDLSRSRWFTRGWTLQELVAPAVILFYDQDGVQFGDKNTLADELSNITKIGKQYILWHGRYRAASVACRMSWASARRTTRTEDMAYCLLGIFDVNMPLLYGEGSKAFLRLQENIMQRNSDDSLFAWTSELMGTVRGLLAGSPRDFAQSGDIFQPRRTDESPPYRLTNKGIELPLLRGPRFWQLIYRLVMPSHLATKKSFVLSCRRKSELNRPLVIKIQKNPVYDTSEVNNGQYVRIEHAEFHGTRRPLLDWFMKTGSYENYYVIPYMPDSMPFIVHASKGWTFKLYDLTIMIHPFLVPVLAALANWRYDNPMFVTVIILLGLPTSSSGNIRVIFLFILVLSGNFGIGPSFSATERRRGQG